MTEPLVVVIPHRLGKDEAARHIKDGIGRAKTEFAQLLRIDNDSWEGDRLSFAASALIHHPLFARLVEADGELVAVHGGHVAVAEFLVKHALADREG